MSRRVRHLAGLEASASARPGPARPCYSLCLSGAALPFSVLTDDALSDLRTRIAHEVRCERARRR